MTDPGELPGAIQVLNKQRRSKIHRSVVASFCAAVLRSLGQTDATLSVVFVSNREMRSMNSRYLGRDYATDVLSFSYERPLVEGQPFLGEIIIAPEIAELHALHYRARPEKELRKLLVHGILHLLGYNHKTDRGQMNRLQNRLLRRKLLAGFPPLALMKERR